MIAIVDYGVGNLASIRNMFRKAGADVLLASDPDAIAGAERLLLPGVGAFDHCVERFDQSGLRPAVENSVAEGRPILGICVGMQMLGRGSEEGTRPGLGWIAGDTVRFRPERAGGELRVPHMGWSGVTPTGPNPLLGPEEAHRFYFLHSFHFVCDDQDDVVAEATHGYAFTCAVGRDNVWGVQFHPEKSHRFGLQLFEKFAAL